MRFRTRTALHVIFDYGKQFTPDFFLAFLRPQHAILTLMLYTIDGQINALKLQIQAGQMAVDRIVTRAARRRLMRLPFIMTDEDRLKAKRREYDTVKRAKEERRRVETLMELRAELIHKRQQLEAVAALL